MREKKWAPGKISSKKFNTAQPRAGGSNLSTAISEAVENHPQNEKKNYIQQEAPGTSQARVGQEGQGSQGRK